jgi:tetratricopeptide (TPR) repeat protein
VRVLFETAEFERAARLIDEAAAAAAKADDDVGAARADLERVLLSTFVGGQVDLIGPALDRLEVLADLFERRGEGEDAARTWAYIGRVRFYQGRCDDADVAWGRAIALAAECGLRRDERDWGDWWLAAKRYGSTPVPDAIADMDAALAGATSAGVPSPTTAFHKASLLAMAGEVEAGLELYERTVPEAPAFGLVAEMAIGMEGGYLLKLAGELERAEVVLRRTWEMSGRIGETGFRSTVGGQLAEVLVAQGRDADALDVLAEVDTFISVDDFEPQSRSRWVRATILARQQRFDEAEALAREAVAVVDRTDYLDQRGEAHRALAGVLALAGSESEAEIELKKALELYERKGNVVRAAEVRERLGA